MKLFFQDGRFVVKAPEHDWGDLRRAGFVFDRIRRIYHTTDWKKAAPFVEDAADDETYDYLMDLIEEREAALDASYAMYADAEIVVPEMYTKQGVRLDYLPYQKAGILYACERRDTLIADPPGLGKTIQAIGMINHLGLTSGVIVCPATLKLNWLREMTKWLYDKSLTVGVAYGGEIPDTDFIIINYDIMHRNKEKLWAEHRDILVCDEAQYLANGDSKRTQAIFGEYRWDFNANQFRRSKQRMYCNHAKKTIKIPCLRAEYRVFLTGTPMMKQPKDMWTMIREADPDGLGKNWEDFAFQYCDATMTAFGLDASGGSNLEELNDILRKTFMIRRLKKHVLKDLPPKTREVIVFPPEGMKKIIKTERDKFTTALAMLDAANAGEVYKPKKAHVDLDPAHVLDTLTKYYPQGFDAPEIGELEPGEIQPGFAAYSQARHDLALSKVPMAVEHIKRLVEAGEKVIVFAIHKDVVAEVYEAFPTAARIIGGLGAKKVEAEKLRFQGDNDNDILPDPDCNVIICNLKAGGVGHTLTEATVVVFIEMWSVPGDMEQCEDRAHRIGLKHNVLVQYLVVDGTIDAITIQELIDRIEMIEEGVDGKERKAA